MMVSVTSRERAPPVETRALALAVPLPQYARLVEMARKAGSTPQAYAGQLFQAAYAARCKPTGDAALDAAVAGLDAAPADDAALDEARASIERLQARLAVREARVAELEAELARVGEGAAISVDPQTVAEAAALRARVAELESRLKDVPAASEPLTLDRLVAGSLLAHGAAVPPAAIAARLGCAEAVVLRIIAAWIGREADPAVAAPAAEAPQPESPARRKRRYSPEAIEAIRAGARKRWARHHARQGGESSP